MYVFPWCVVHNKEDSSTIMYVDECMFFFMMVKCMFFFMMVKCMFFLGVLYVIMKIHLQ